MAKSKLNVRLLRRIQRKILAEPAQFQMGQYFATEVNGIDLPREKIPNCGTAACIAGWAVALSEHRKPSRYIRLIERNSTTIKKACKALGINNDPTRVSRLFIHSFWPSNLYARWYRAITLKQRAKVAVAAIDQFIKDDGKW